LPPPPYDLETARQALTMIAIRMNVGGTRDLNWWQISEWAPRTPRISVSAGVAALLGGLTAGSWAGSRAGSRQQWAEADLAPWGISI
jgi:hypothetical protein